MVVTLDPDAIRRAREATGLGRHRAAQRAGVSMDTIRGLEKGKHQPSLSVAYRLAQAYGITIEEMVKVADE